MKFVIFLALLHLFCTSVFADKVILNSTINEYKSKITLPPNGKLEMIFDDSTKENLTIISCNKTVIVEVTIYTPDGKKIPFRGPSIRYTGKISSLIIENTDENENQVKIYCNTYTYSSFDTLHSIIGICCTISVIFFDTKSYVVKFFFSLLLIMQIYKTPDIINMGNLIKNSILRIR